MPDRLVAICLGAPVNPFNNFVECTVARLALNYRINASVSGGHGRVSPANQTAIAGEPARITITPDPGYRIGSITDNGNVMEIASPYVIRNVQNNHGVVVVFEPDDYPPTINLTAARKTEKAWIIQKEYREINIEITEHPTNPMDVSRYILYRIDGASMVQLAEFATAGSHSYIDKYLEKGKAVGYVVTAVDAAGTVVAESETVEI